MHTGSFWHNVFIMKDTPVILSKTAHRTPEIIFQQWNNDLYSSLCELTYEGGTGLRIAALLLFISKKYNIAL